MRRYIFLACITAVILGGCRPAESYRQASGAVWGTTYHITYRADRDLHDSVVAEMRRVERSLSMFDPASTVSRVNDSLTLGPIEVDSMFAEVFALSQRVSAVSDGAFDPTVQPLVDLWGFGPSHIDEEEAPSIDAIDSALATVGIARCRIDGLTLYKAHPATRFDFSAVAKGYGVDRVAAALRRCGSADYMVEIGGEVAVSGRNPRGEDWHIALEAPEAGSTPGSNPTDVLTLTSGAVATSGNYRNYREFGDTIVAHTIDPVSGRPVYTTIAAATVQAPTCALADALATACMALPSGRALALADSLPGVTVRLVSRRDGTWHTAIR